MCCPVRAKTEARRNTAGGVTDIIFEIRHQSLHSKLGSCVKSEVVQSYQSRSKISSFLNHRPSVTKLKTSLKDQTPLCC